MKTKNLVLGPALGLLTLTIPLAVACGGQQPATETGERPTVTAATATAERLAVPDRVELYGRVEADQVAAVSARVMATVTRLHVQPGDTVRRGQVLLEIDPQAAEGQVAQARGALAQAEAGLALAARNHERFTALAETHSASELELDLARMQHEQAQGAVEQARGALAAASSVAGDSRVVAPFAGRVVQKLVEVGDLAAPGRPLLMIESQTARRMALAVPESVVAASRLAPGQQVPAAIDARPDLGVLAGRVVEMTPGADAASHSYQVKVELPAPDLPTGSSGRAWIGAGDRQAVVVPAAAVLRQGGLDMVVVVDAEGRTSSRVVTLGDSLDDGRREVLSGLDGGETVLVGLAVVPPAGSRVEAP